MKKQQTETASGVQDLCRKLKMQLDELSVSHVVERKKAPSEDEIRLKKLMEELKKQLADLSK